MNSMIFWQTEDQIITIYNKTFYSFIIILMTKEIMLTGKNIAIEDIVSVWRNKVKIIIPPETLIRVQENRGAIAEMLDRGDVMYGLNTGIGWFGNVVISRDQAWELSTRMLRAHASWYGDFVEEEIARATLFLRLSVFAQGYSGVRVELLQTFVEMLNKWVVPTFYEKWSVGTSWDLAPLSQMWLVIIGEGNAYYQWEILPGAEAMKKAGIPLVSLAYREGLAIMNGTQFMSAIAAFNVYDAERLIKQAEISGSMTLDVLNCVETAFDARYNELKPYKWQNNCAKNIRRMLAWSEILKQKKENVQNAYSLRALPQVLWAMKDSLDFIRKMTETEMNSVADNPIFITTDKVALAWANFHGAPIWYTQDLLGIIITDLWNLSERQTNNLLDPACSWWLPAFLVKTPGLDSWLMISQYTQAALVSENKSLASPASVDSIPVSANQEDHVSFGTIAARQAREIIKNTEAVVAIQLLVVCQAYEFKKNLKPSPTFQAVYNLIREVSPAIEEDRAFYKDIEIIVPLVRNYQVLEEAEKMVGKLN